jgi:predicted transposase YbfD/YdcC
MQGFYRTLAEARSGVTVCTADLLCVPGRRPDHPPDPHGAGARHHAHRERLCAHLLSLSPRQATPERLLVLIRGHWSVESRRWRRAVTCGEERSRRRRGAAPQIVAAVRNLVFTLIRRTGTTQIAAYRQHLRSRPASALRFLVPKTRSA